MAKIFIGLALALMLGTAILGFLAKGKVEMLQTTLKDTKRTLSDTQGTLAKTKTELEHTKDDLTAANGKVDELTKDVAAKAGQIDDLTKKMADATAAIDAKTKEIADLNAKIATMVPAAGSPSAPGEDPRIADLQSQVTKAQTELAEQKQVLASLNNQIRDKDAKLAAADQERRRREQMIMRPGITGRILAVDPNWNFFIINIGDKQGVLANAPMLIMRNGEPIARARISSVEPAISIADTIPGSVRKGVRVEPGDSVVFEGRSNTSSSQSQGSLNTSSFGNTAALPER